jgi:hypothetical protein
MAIITGLPGIEVGIRVGNAASHTTEYADPDPDERPASLPPLSSTTYVQSVDDTEFNIHYVMSEHETTPYFENNNCLSLHFSVDGNRVDKKIYDGSYFRHGFIDSQCRGLKELSPGGMKMYLRKFRFSSVTTGELPTRLFACPLLISHTCSVDEATFEKIESDAKKAKSLGIIRVDIYHKGPMTESVRQISSLSDAPADTQLELSEKALKGRAISHGTTSVII